MTKEPAEIIISLKNVSKKYNISNRQQFVALNNVCLTVARGDRIGIIGNNGAGKTTLLKIIGGIAKPSSGEVITKGNIVSLIDLESGFEPELTGYENIMANGLIIGMRKKDIMQHLSSIIEFADIGPYINEPFFTYSAGMKFRLACAVAINSKAEVLLFDEIFLSSDWNFQKKIFYTLKEMLRNNTLTTIISSHVPEILWSLANTYYSMNKGVITKIQRNEIRRLAVNHHFQFHSTFKTNEIKEFALKRNGK